jgi:hypothetical protein
MGYRRPRKTFVLRFDDPEYQGLEVRVGSLPIGDFLNVTRTASRVDSKDYDPAQVADLLAMFGRCLISWNLEDDEGRAIPANLEGLRSLDLDFVLTLIASWMEGVASVSVPLGETSRPGGSPMEESLPMVVS